MRCLIRRGRCYVAFGAVRSAAEAAQSAADVLVEKAERRGHDEAEIRQRVQRQRNAEDGVEHRHQPTAVGPWCYVAIACNHPNQLLYTHESPTTTN